jgi:hypothetical protein
MKPLKKYRRFCKKRFRKKKRKPKKQGGISTGFFYVEDKEQYEDLMKHDHDFIHGDVYHL